LGSPSGVEQRMPSTRKMGILGAKCSHTHLAFINSFKVEEYELEFFESERRTPPHNVFERLIRSVSGIDGAKVDCALIPCHNSSEKHFFDEMSSLIIKDGVYVVDIVKKYIKHSLLANHNVEHFSEIKKIISNRHCFLQSGDWLTKNLLDVEREIVSSSSEAAKIVQQESDKKCAVIGTSESAAEYSLKVLVESIEKPNNYTSFFVISHKERNFLGNPYLLYAIPVASQEQKTRIEEKVREYLFETYASWYSPEIGRYFFELFVGQDEKKVNSFEFLMAEEFKGFKRIGRLNKNIGAYTL